MKLRILLVVIAIVAAACSGNATDTTSTSSAGGTDTTMSNEPITITVTDDFTDENVSAAADQIYANFMEAHPNVTIERTVSTRETNLTTIRSSLNAGQGPDVFAYDLGLGNAGVLADAGLLMPVEDLPLDPTTLMSDWALAQANYGGTDWGYPAFAEVLGIFWNQTLIEEAGLTIPETDTELLQFCADAQAAGFVPLAYTNNPGWQAFHQLAIIGNNGAGADYMTSLLLDDEGSWEDQAIVDAVDLFFVEMVDAGCYPDDLNAIEYGDGNALMTNGEALGVPTGGWVENDLSSESVGDWTYVYTPFPSINGNVRVVPTTVGEGFWVDAKTKHPEAVAQFIQHLFSPESSQIWIEVGGYNPTGPYDVNALDVTPLRAFILQTLQDAANGTGADQGPWVDTIAPEQFLTQMQTGFQEVIGKVKTAAEQMAALQAAWDEGLASLGSG